MNTQTLQTALAAKGWTKQAVCLTATDSTNLEAHRRLNAGTPAPFIITADSQTAGRGQRGHSFASPAATGLYMSVVLPTPVAINLLMPAAGVSAAYACVSVGGPAPQLKWVNDLFLGSAKIGGLLTWLEPSPSPSVIVGWGLNIQPPADATALAVNQPTTTLFNHRLERDIRPQLVAAFVSKLTTLLARPELIMPAFRVSARGVGHPVILHNGPTAQRGVLTGFDDDGGIIITTADGIITANSGSIELL